MSEHHFYDLVLPIAIVVRTVICLTYSEIFSNLNLLPTLNLFAYL